MPADPTPPEAMAQREPQLADALRQLCREVDRSRSFLGVSGSSLNALARWTYENRERIDAALRSTAAAGGGERERDAALMMRGQCARVADKFAAIASDHAKSCETHNAPWSAAVASGAATSAKRIAAAIRALDTAGNDQGALQAFSIPGGSNGRE